LVKVEPAKSEVSAEAWKSFLKMRSKQRELLEGLVGKGVFTKEQVMDIHSGFIPPDCFTAGPPDYFETSCEYMRKIGVGRLAEIDEFLGKGRLGRAMEANPHAGHLLLGMMAEMGEIGASGSKEEFRAELGKRAARKFSEEGRRWARQSFQLAVAEVSREDREKIVSELMKRIDMGKLGRIVRGESHYEFLEYVCRTRSDAFPDEHTGEMTELAVMAFNVAGAVYSGLKPKDVDLVEESRQSELLGEKLRPAIWEIIRADARAKKKD